MLTWCKKKLLEFFQVIVSSQTAKYLLRGELISVPCSCAGNVLIIHSIVKNWAESELCDPLYKTFCLFSFFFFSLTYYTLNLKLHGERWINRKITMEYRFFCYTYQVCVSIHLWRKSPLLLCAKIMDKM